MNFAPEAHSIPVVLTLEHVDAIALVQSAERARRRAVFQAQRRVSGDDRGFIENRLGFRGAGYQKKGNEENDGDFHV